MAPPLIPIAIGRGEVAPDLFGRETEGFKKEESCTLCRRVRDSSLRCALFRNERTLFIPAKNHL